MWKDILLFSLIKLITSKQVSEAGVVFHAKIQNCGKEMQLTALTSLGLDRVWRLNKINKFDAPFDGSKVLAQ